MAKSRRPSKGKRNASASRRTGTTKRSKTSASKSKPKSKRKVKSLATVADTSDRVELKPIRAQIVRAVERLRGIEATERTRLTIERLERCVAEFDDICDPNNPFGCGPDMAFPPTL